MENGLRGPSGTGRPARWWLWRWGWWDDHARVLEEGREKGRVWVVWEAGWRPTRVPGPVLLWLATVGSSVSVIIGWTLRPVTWHRVGAWTCLLNRWLQMKRPFVNGDTPFEKKNHMLPPPPRAGTPWPPISAVNHPQTYPAVGSLLLRERILEREDSHILNLSQETLSPWKPDR